MVSSPGPPHSSGIIMPQQPSSAIFLISAEGKLFFAVALLHGGANFGSMNWRTVSRISFWWSLREKSIGVE